MASAGRGYGFCGLGQDGALLGDREHRVHELDVGAKQLLLLKLEYQVLGGGVQRDREAEIAGAPPSPSAPSRR